MCKNQKLKESLQLLSQTTCALYEKELRLDDRYQNDLTHVYIALSSIDPKVKEIPEFNVCLGLMAQDKKINALQGKLVGTDYSGQTIVENEEACILSFLQQLYLVSKKYDQAVFYEKYLSFEDFFYSDQLAFKDSANLYNFSFNKIELVLGHGITIRAVDPSSSRDDYAERINRPYVAFSKSIYVMERNYEAKKRVGDDFSIQDEIKNNKELSETKDLFDLVIDSLRILKSSAVYRDHRIKTESITFHPHGTIMTRWSSFFENIAVGEKCNIDATDVPMLCKVFDFLCSENNSRFKVAQRRLSLGIERKSPEDRLIDYMIGLETLYLPDKNVELSFRLSVRVAFLLSSGTDKKDTFYFLRKMYGIRSKIVHGSKYKLNAEDLNKLEDLLRKSVILWIDGKYNFSDGKLDTMLFNV
jgi:hypothetical protein